MAKKRKSRKSRKSSSSSSYDFVVTSRVKEFLSKKGYRSSADLIDELNDVIKCKLEDAADRADDNGRSTVRGSDV